MLISHLFETGGCDERGLTIGSAAKRLVVGKAKQFFFRSILTPVTAMIALKEAQGSFADAVIAALGARMGCPRTLTFDQKALPLPGFKRP